MKEIYSIRLNPELKKQLQEIGSKTTENILSTLLENMSDTSMEIIIIKTEINQLNYLKDKLITDNNCYNEKIKKYTELQEGIKSEINSIDTTLNKYNKKLLKYTELQENENRELEQMFQKIINLIDNNKCIELEVQEVVESRKYCKTNEIIEYCINRLNKENSEKYIDVLQNVKVS